MRLLPSLVFSAALFAPVCAQTYGPFTYDPANVLGQAHDASGAILWSDFDADGDLDVAIGNAFGPEELFVNEGSGVYNRRLLPEQVQRIDASGGAWADLDGDGRLDLLMCGLHAGGFVYWQGDGGSFEQVKFYTPNGVRDCTIADVDSDGRPDIFVLHRSYESRPSRLFLNRGDRTFALEQELYVGDGSQASWADIDGDGDLDLYHGLTSGQPDRLFYNEEGVLRAAQGSEWPQLITHSQGGAWGDYDGDGDFDLLVTDKLADNVIYRNEGGRFTIASTEESGASFGSTWGDVNNDGRLDRVSMDMGSPGRLHIRLADGEEERIAIGSGQEGMTEAVTLVDHDGDGDLDLFVTYGRLNEAEPNRVYLNQSAGGNWLQVALEGEETIGSLGAVVRLYDQENEEVRGQMRAVLPRSGRKAQTGATLHFGLGTSPRADSLLVRWPSGACRTLLDVRANQVLRISEPVDAGCALPTGQLEFPIPDALWLDTPAPNPSRTSVQFGWRAPIGVPYTVEVIDALGRTVYRVQGVASGSPETMVWDMARHVAPGTYAVRLRAGDGDVLTRRLTVAR